MDRRLSPPSRLDYLLAGLLSLIAFLVYRATLTPSLSYLSPDGNELATVPYVLGLAHSPGYPLYTWLGKLFTLLPFGDVAHRVNLMSAVLGALAVGGLYLLLVQLLHPRAAAPALRRAAATAAALAFAFTPTYWSQAVIAEVYAPNMAMIALTLLALLRWERTRRDRDFFLFALLFGLSLGTHLSDLGFAPAFALFVLLTAPRALKRPTWWLAGLAGFGLGAAQFLWLPLKAGTLVDRMMLARAPSTLVGIYKYTLGAFPQFKFAFPLSALPDRVVVYLDLLLHEFSLLGVLLGVIGLGALLLRRPRHYYLLVGMYLVHVWFFIQYRAFDLEVFFLPAHFLWAVFVAFGLLEALAGLEALAALALGARARRPARYTLALAACLLALLPLPLNWSQADRSQDVAVNDFYANVWALLPPQSALLTQGGVFGYDAFYWQLVYGTRSDVLLPALPISNPSPADLQRRPLFTTTALQGRGRARGPGALPQDLVPADAWQVPVLLGNPASEGFGARNRLVLFEIRQDPPQMVVDQAQPQIIIGAEYGPVTLLGADVEPLQVESGSALHMRLYWRLQSLERLQVETRLGDQTLEVHELGLGLLARYDAQVEPVRGQIVVEDYWVVVPSTVSPGNWDLTIGPPNSPIAVTLARLQVVDEEEAMQRWLRIAGK